MSVASYHDSVNNDRMKKRAKCLPQPVQEPSETDEGWIKATKSKLEISFRICRFAKCQDKTQETSDQRS